MILGIERFQPAECFRELDDAITALQNETGDPRTVVLNAHAFPLDIPPDAIIYNLENVGIQVDPRAFGGHELWDFSERNVKAWGGRAKHVPVGYHPSMKRFDMRPWEERDIDVVFTGCMNTRRQLVLSELRSHGLNVEVVGAGQSYGKERDAILARSKLALNMLFHADGTFAVLRAAHLAANGLACVHEMAPEAPAWAGPKYAYPDLVKRCLTLLGDRPLLEAIANEARADFMASPMELPAPPRPWTMLRDKPAEEWDLEAMYDKARGGPVSDKPFVAIAMPRYRESGRVTRIVEKSLERVEADLEGNGIDTGRIDIEGDSLVTRMRQRVCQMFLRSPATHLLFCDADIEVLDPSCVRLMLSTGHDVVAGACPFKTTEGRVVCNLWPDTAASMTEGANLELPKGCIEVMDAGTGFMLISRVALIRMMKAHPELLHWSQSRQDRGEPLFALFDTGIHDGVYQSEDYRFCRYWQELGGKVYVYVPATFRHWGEMGFEGSFVGQYGLMPTFQMQR